MNSIIVANWKMNPATLKEAKALFEATRKAVDRLKGVSIIVAPPTIFLRALSEKYKGRRISFAVQNTHFEASGAYTGEISLAQAKDAKATAVIIGHAERRAMGESDEDVKKKVRAALAEKLLPILCIGESVRDKSGEHFDFVRKQLRAALGDIGSGKIGKLLIAYEPVWAIGATSPMSARDMHEMVIFIRKTLVDMHGAEGMQARILYGGSIDKTSARTMLDEGDVDGLLVGRASSQSSAFSELLASL